MLFKKFNFRKRLLLTFLLVFVPLIFIGSTIAYFQVERIVETGIKKELKSSTDSLLNLIKTSAHVSVKNRLRAIAEKNLDIARFYYRKYERGELTKKEAIQMIEEVFLSQTIGTSGYIYCLNSKGIIKVHPKEPLIDSDLSNYGFIQKQLKHKQGYIEYDWRNPEEAKKRPKALYMVYFEPLDWIISVSSYRKEFNVLVDIQDFQESILSCRFGKTGYAYVMGDDGTALIHPSIQGVNLLHQEEYPNEFFKQILKEKNGTIRYFWKNPGEAKAREKMVLFKHLPEFKWIVGSSNYVEEVFSPLKTFRLYLIALLIVFLLSAIASFYWISGAITKPLTAFIKKLDQGSKGDFTIRMESEGQDEFGQLANHFNSFMHQLSQTQEVIETQNQKNIEARRALVENELKLRSLFNQSFQYTGILSPAGVLEEVNQSGLDATGANLEDVIFKPFWELPYWDHDPEVRQRVKEAVKKASNGTFVRFETTSISKENEIRNIDITIKPVLNPSGDVAFIITEGRDITTYKMAAKERKDLAVQMEKAQKMEAIGTLAGGIAHDFNNILSGILGYAQLTELNISEPAKAKEHIAHIIRGARRAARLTQQILTFGRQTEYEKHPMELALILKEALKLLRSSIPASIDMQEHISTNKMIMADTTQMHQVIMNLCTNAYHAIGEKSGTLTVRLDTVFIENEEDFWGQELKTGEYLQLSVADTGVGMDAETVLKAFDPYFTTKDVGKGTGFGLALVHAIIDEHDGYINVDSSVGIGSEFFVYLPVVEPLETENSDKPQIQLHQGSETIMVVDDEQAIRDVLQQALEKYGYTVHVFEDGLEAFKTFKKDPDKFDLILTDMTMPKMTGDELAKSILEIRKDLPVVLCTGYSETMSESTARQIGIKQFIFKPVSNDELIAVIQQVLGE